MKMTADEFLDMLTALFQGHDNALQSDGYWEVLAPYPQEPDVLASGEIDVVWAANGWDGVVTI